MSEELPPEGMAKARPSAVWGSTLSSQEFAAVSGVGFTPVGQVFGAAVYAAGSGTGSCPGSFDPLVEAMYQARHAAMDRMTGECAALGGHGVVAVRLSSGDTFSFGELEFTAMGTAVRAAKAVGQPAPGPFSSALSGQGFARLITAGWVPVGLALGIAIGSRHDDLTATRQARPWSPNAEMTGWTELVNRVRQDARRRLEQDVRRLGAEGVVTADMRMRVRQRDCPAAVGRRDHVVEVTLIGTAVASFDDASFDVVGRRARPALPIMPLGPWRGARPGQD